MQKRIEKSEKQENKHIGINKYFNNEPSKTAWKVEIETAFGTPVILEKDCQIEVQL